MLRITTPVTTNPQTTPLKTITPALGFDLTGTGLGVTIFVRANNTTEEAVMLAPLKTRSRWGSRLQRPPRLEATDRGRRSSESRTAAHQETCRTGERQRCWKANREEGSCLDGRGRGLGQPDG